MRFKCSGRALVGVDIGSSSIKLVELTHAAGHFRLDGCSVHPLYPDPGAVVDRRIQHGEAMVASLREAVERAGLINRRACVAVPADAAITKVLTLPASLDDDEIEARIQLESDQHIPFPFAEVAFDFQRLSVDVRSGRQNVLLVACRRQDVDRLAGTLLEAGLEPEAVDVDTFAMERVCANLSCQFQVPVTGDEDGMALVNVGHVLHFHVLSHGRIVYRRDVTLDACRTGGDMPHFSSSLIAERLIEERPVSGAGERAVSTSFIDVLARQVERSLQFYRAEGSLGEIKRMAIAGGAVDVLPELRERLAKVSGMEVVIADPFRRMRHRARRWPHDVAGMAPAMLTACGLAMRMQT